MVRGACGLTVAWTLSCSPLVLPAIFPSLRDAVGESSRFALAALPWIAWLGLPGRGREAADRTPANALASAALAAPPLAAGFGLDLSRGADLVQLGTLAVWSGAMIAVLAWAADLAAGAPARGRWYAAAWLVLVPGALFLHAGLAVGGAPTYGDPPRWLSVLAGASPLDWIWGCAARSTLGSAPAAPAALGSCLVLLAIAGFSRERAG